MMKANSQPLDDIWLMPAPALHARAGPGALRAWLRTGEERALALEDRIFKYVVSVLSGRLVDLQKVAEKSLEDTIQNVYDTQKDVEQKQYLLATGQLEDAHSLPIAQAKAELSLEVMISLRNKAMEAYNEILKMSV